MNARTVFHAGVHEYDVSFGISVQTQRLDVRTVPSAMTSRQAV